MKKGLHIIEQKEYKSFVYDNKTEERKHRSKMIKRGWHLASLCGVDDGEECYSRTKIIKFNRRVDEKRFEYNHQGYCEHTESLKPIGIGSFASVGRYSRLYNAYYCEKCKRAYLEDFNENPMRLFYSKKLTIDYLKNHNKEDIQL